MIALFHIEVGDASERGGAHVHVGLGLDLPGAADDGRQVLLHQFRRQDLGVSGLLLDNKEGYKPGNHNKANNDEKNLFHVQCLLPALPQLSLRKRPRDGSHGTRRESANQ